MQITGRIQRGSIKGARYAFLVGDKWLSFFVNKDTAEDVAKVIKGLREGDECEFEIFVKKGERGDFYNITGILPIQDTGGEGPPEPEEPGEDSKAPAKLKEDKRTPEEKRTASIVLQAIMKAAAILAAASGETIEERCDAWPTATRKGLEIYTEIMSGK